MQWFRKIIHFIKTRKARKLQKKITLLYKQRQSNSVSDADLAKEIAYNLELAEYYDKKRWNTHFPYAELLAQEAYRAAASLNDVNAQYLLSKRLVKMARFWQERSQGIYAMQVHQRYANDLYEEAFAYLETAEKQGHALAKRLHGLAYINGWGVEKEEEKGFQMVVDSIEQEKAWDRATQIFTELGLNKSEFFSSIMRQKR